MDSELVHNFLGRNLALTVHLETLRHRIQPVQRDDIVRSDPAGLEELRKPFEQLT